MLRGLVKLASQAQQTRKIIILITDGVPSDDAKARVLVENIKASGIEVYCIGIDLKRDAPMVVKNIFGVSCFIEINTAEQLQHEILQLAHACM
jgi:nitric oxide reductase activation protein